MERKLMASVELNHKEHTEICNEYKAPKTGENPVISEK